MAKALATANLASARERAVGVIGRKIDPCVDFKAAWQRLTPCLVPGDGPNQGHNRVASVKIERQ